MNKLMTRALLLISITTVQSQNMDRSSEVVARVNDDFITRQDLLNAVNEHKLQVAGRSGQLADTADSSAGFEALRPAILDELIDGLLLEQKATELGLDTDSEIDEFIVDPALVIPRGYRDVLDNEREIDPEHSKALLRKRILRQYVIQREILVPLYAQISPEDRLDFYGSHKDEFVVPANVTLSGILLPFDNNSVTSIELRAFQLLADLQSGADFARSVRENTPPSSSSWAQGGYLGRFEIEELRESVAIATSTLKPGEFTEPIRLSDGYMIIRVDGRINATQRSYDDPEVQLEISRSILLARAEGAHRDYVSALREKARIVIF